MREYWKGGNKYFLKEFEDGEAKAFLSPAMRYGADYSRYGVEGYYARKVYYLDYIRVTPQYRGEGLGSEVLKAIVKWADISRNAIILDAVPIDDGMDDNRLIRFYLGHGFAFPTDYHDDRVGRELYYVSKYKARVDRNSLKV